MTVNINDKLHSISARKRVHVSRTNALAATIAIGIRALSVHRLHGTHRGNWGDVVHLRGFLMERDDFPKLRHDTRARRRTSAEGRLESFLSFSRSNCS